MSSAGFGTGSLATEIDRVALCIHGPTARRPALREAIESLGVQLPQPTIVASAASLLATGEPLTVDDLALLSRYERRGDLVRVLDAHAAVGVLSRSVDDDNDDAYLPTPSFAAVARRVVELQVASAEWLWRDEADVVAQLVDVTASVLTSVDAGRGGAELAAFDQQRRPPEPASPFGKVLRRVTVLRYLRSDVHAAALADVMGGLAGREARALDHAWRRGELGADESARRHEVERVTESRFAAFVGEQAEVLLDGLRRLPGEDPRDDLLPLPDA